MTSTSHPNSVPDFPRAPLRGVEGPGETRQRPSHVLGTSSTWVETRRGLRVSTISLFHAAPSAPTCCVSRCQPRISAFVWRFRRLLLLRRITSTSLRWICDDRVGAEAKPPAVRLDSRTRRHYPPSEASMFTG